MNYCKLFLFLRLLKSNQRITQSHIAESKKIVTHKSMFYLREVSEVLGLLQSIFNF